MCMGSREHLQESPDAVLESHAKEVAKPKDASVIHGAGNHPTGII